MPRAFDTPQLLLPDAIAHHGRWRAGRPALICGEARRSWAQFDAATNRIANGLIAAGLRKGDRIAVLMASSIEMVELMFGAGKAGVSVVPINVSVSDAAVVAMLTDSGATAIAASGSHCGRIDQMDVAALRLKLAVDAPSPARDWTGVALWRDAQSPTAPNVAIAPGDECNIIYSSGTTGLPKGIVHSQGCRRNWAIDLGLALRYHSGAVTVCSIGLYSNIMWATMLSTLLLGGTIVVLPSFSVPELLDAIQQHRVTHGAFVPVQLQRLLERGVQGSDVGSLQAIMCCGSPLPLAVKREIPHRLGCALIELYGLTEGLVTTLDPEDFERKIESVGRPLPGQRLKLVGADDREVAAGYAGEIVGLGRVVMDGYHNRPDATLEATWTDDAGLRWLRTGDIGRLDDEGFLYLLDRKKDLILSGGQNIYPADLEAVLLEHRAVVDVAVIGIPDERWGETPLAIVVPHTADSTDACISAAELRDWANARLGKQQRITAVIFVAQLPRNPNGKILKRELRTTYAAFHV